MAKHTDPAHASGGNTRKVVAQGRSKGKHVAVSKAMHRKHGTASKGQRKMSWWMSAGK